MLRKIATPQELVTEIQDVLRYASGSEGQPSRQVISDRLLDIAFRTAADQERYARGKFYVELVKKGDGPVKTEKVGYFDTKPEALKAAKKAAGRGAKFFTKGTSYGYDGPDGMVYVSD